MLLSVLTAALLPALALAQNLLVDGGFDSCTTDSSQGQNPATP